MPKVVLARLHTGTTIDVVKARLKGRGFTRNEMKAAVRCMNYFDGLELRLARWNWDGHRTWHLYGWGEGVDGAVMKALFEAEQIRLLSCLRYKGDFKQFEKDWKDGTYEPGAALTFEDGQVEVLEVLQEEVDNIDHDEVRREVSRAECAKSDRLRKQRMRLKTGRYYRKLF